MRDLPRLPRSTSRARSIAFPLGDARPTPAPCPMCSACSPRPASPSRSSRSPSAGTPTIDNLYARFGDAARRISSSPAIPTSCRPATWRAGAFDPFSATHRRRQLWGRGACDMKGGVAAALAAALRFVARGAFTGSISFLVTGDEEGPAVNGTVKLLEWALRARRAFRPLPARRADQPRRARRHDQERPARLADRPADADRQAGPRRLSPSRRQSDPRAGADPRRAAGAAARFRRTPTSTPRTSRSSASTSAIRRPTSFPARCASSSTCASTICWTPAIARAPKSSGASPRRRGGARYDARPSIRPTRSPS